MKITSQPLTFLDTTDSRKLEVYISSNHPTIQLYDVNDKKYTPDWSATNLKLRADAFLDSTETKPEKMKWYRQYINEATETLVSSGDYTEEITVNSNMVQAVVTYICRAEYQGIQAFSKITFTRTDTGLNGTDGKDGTSVTIDGTAYYNETLSDDMVGQLISLYADDEFTTPLDTSSMVEGDSYVVQGYLCVYSPANDKFICVGRIQGPKGENGDSAKSIVLSGDSQVFKGSKTMPIAYTPSIIKLTVNRINIPTTTILTWSYNHNDNKGWTTVKPDSVVISGDTATITGASMITDSLTIKVSDGTVEDVFTVYRAFDGADGVKGDTASMAFLTNENTSFPAGADGKTNVLTTFRTNVVAYNGTEKVTPTIGSISDIYGNLPEGMSVVPNKGTAYAKVELTANNAVISDLYSDKDTKNVINKSKLTNGDSFVVGDYLYKYDSTNQNFKSNTVIVDGTTYLDRIVTNNEITLLFSVPTGKTLGKDGNAVGEVTIPVISPVSTNLLLSWTKINAGPEGEPGVGINKIDVEYGKSENLDIRPEDISWSTTIPVVDDGWYLWTKTIIDYTDSAKQDTVTYTYAKQGSKGDTGTSVSDVDIEYIASNNPTTPPSSGWSSAIVATTAEKPYLWTKTTFKLEDGATKNAYSVARYGTDGAKGDKGDQGIQGIQGPKGDQGVQGPAGANGKPSYFHIKYSANSNGNPMTETPSTYIGTYVDDQEDDSTDYLKYTWSRFVGSQGAKGDQGIAGTNGVDGKTSYLHIAYATSANGSSGFSVSDSVNKTYIGQYTDYTEADSTDYTKYKWTLIKGDKGDKGDQGVQGPKGNDGQQLYTWVKYADTPTSGMSNSPDGKTYIGLAYNKTTATESSTYSDYMWSLIKGETGPTGPKGADGQQYYTWIKYADNASGANMSDSPTGKLYIGLAYNKTTSTESNTASDYTWALFKGDKGDKGDDAYTVLLTNESHVFAGSISAAIASSATTQVLAYNGATSQSVTIVSVNGVTASTASTATGIAGLSFKCSALSGTSPTITFTCTTSFVSPNGTIPIVIKVGSISITKMFTYSIAFKGATGGQGNQGNPGSPATAYWLVSSAGVVQKTSTGTVVLTPSALTFTGKSKTGTNTPVDYGCRWIIAYSTDGTNYTNAYTSPADEASKAFTVDDTYKAIRVRMYLAGGTTTLLDEQIIPVVTDGAAGAPGDDAVTFQIYSSNGYALSINAPTVTLQTFAYIGDIEITAGATYQWYVYNDTGWTAITDASNAYLIITREDVEFSKSYMCKMTFNGVEYTSVATIDDKNDENKVFTSKPSNYSAGDLWVVGADYVPTGIELGTLLRAEYPNTTYKDSDWITATKYDDKLDKLQESLDTYNQYFSFSSADGLKISAKDANGTPSKFSTSLNNERLSFNYGNESIAYISGTKMNIKEAEIESPLTVTGKYSGSTMLQAPVINIGNFSIIVESNGSLSIVANT